MSIKYDVYLFIINKKDRKIIEKWVNENWSELSLSFSSPFESDPTKVIMEVQHQVNYFSERLKEFPFKENSLYLGRKTDTEPSYICKDYDEEREKQYASAN